MRKKGGYIAITSAVIISILILVITLALSFLTFSSRFNISDSERKERNKALAEACVELAVLRLAQSAAYAGNEDILVGNEKCSILPIETNGEQKTIKTKAAVSGLAANLKVVINVSDFSVVSWEELPSS